MAQPNEQNKRSPGKKRKGKVGSDPEAAREVGGKGDFGVPASGGSAADRNYVSQNTKASDPGAAQPGSSEFDELRTHGAGGKASGTGSSSGGDIDTDIVGIGGSGLAATGPEDRPGADDTDGSSDQFASGPRAKGENQDGVGKIGGPNPVHQTMPKANADAGEPGDKAPTQSVTRRRAAMMPRPEK